MTETVTEMARLLSSGLTGRPLLAALTEQFSHAKRSDVFLAVAMAITLREADLVQFEFERTREEKLARGSVGMSL
jgi:hypothetical protein